MTTAQGINNGGSAGGDDDQAAETHLGPTGAHLDQLCDPDGEGGLTVRDVFSHELGSALLGWHLRTMQHGDKRYFGPHTDPNNPPLAELLAVPTTDRVPDVGPLVAEALAEKGIEVPGRAACLAWDKADRAAGGIGGDADLEYAYAMWAIDPELTATSAAEKRICGVPESIYTDLSTDDRAKVAAGEVIASPSSINAVAAWVVRNHLTVRSLLPGQTGRRQRRLVSMRTLTRIGETWYQYTVLAAGEPPRWVPRTDPEWMRGRLRAVLRGMYYVKMRKPDNPVYELKPWPSKVGDLREVEAALADLLKVDGEVATTARELPDAYGQMRRVYPADGTLALCRNGVLDLNTGKLVSNTPLWFSLSRIEANYDHSLDPAAGGTEWMGMLMDQWADDPAAIACLGEWFGYVLSGRTDKQKAMFIRGVTGSGKGNIAAVLMALVSGSVSTGLNRLNSNFGLAKLYTSGTTLAVMGDVRFNTPDSSQAVENLLGVIGQDVMPIDIKYRDEVDAALPVRFHMSANEFPNIPDNSAAIARRLLMLNAEHSFEAVADPGLRRRIISNELGQVLRWAVAGLARLDAAGDFTRSKCHDELIAAFKVVMSPTLSFAQECCTAGDGGEYVTQEEVWRAWNLWAAQNGHKPGTKVRFLDKLTSLPDYPLFKTGQKRGAGRVVYGLAKINQHTAFVP